MSGWRQYSFGLVESTINMHNVDLQSNQNGCLNGRTVKFGITSNHDDKYVVEMNKVE